MKLDLSAFVGVVDPATGLLWAIPKNAPGSRIQVTFEGGVNPDFRNLVNASLLLYANALSLKPTLSSMIEALEEVEAESLTAAVMRMEAALNVALLCAEQGIEIISRDRDKRD